MHLFQRRFARRLVAVLAVASAALAAAGQAVAADEEVNLYSYRQAYLIQPILDAFTEKTGIKVNAVYAEKGILERLKAEGPNSPADVVLAADVGALNDMVEAGVLQPVSSPVLEETIPAQYRHPEGLWYGLTTRARVIVASKDRVGADEIRSYEDLADPRFKGRACTRSGKHVYMVSLIASMIAHEGEEKAEAWLRGVKDNLAQKPQGNDRAQIKAVYEGACDVAVVNTYYLGHLATTTEEPEQNKWAEAVRIVFPNQDGRGAHVNVSGAAVTKSASNRENAIKLLEYLAGDEAQKLYAEQNFEYPIKEGVPVHPVVASWGEFKADDIRLSEVAKHREAASRLVDEVGYDEAAGT
jgi:iron(III) transport system substrate-binding protein